jgi:hypothetical protein
MANSFHDATVCFGPLAGHAGTHEVGGALNLSLSNLPGTAPKATKGRCHKKDNEAENIVRGLVTEYLNCSTHISGIFCW